MIHDIVNGALSRQEETPEVFAMSISQKSALFQLAVGLAAGVAYGALLVSVGAEVAPAAFAILGLVGLDPVLFRRGIRDERDRLIARKALIVGAAAYHLFIVGLCMLVWLLRFRLEPPTVSVSILPLIVMGAYATLIIVRSAAILALDRRGLDQATA